MADDDNDGVVSKLGNQAKSALRTLGGQLKKVFVHFSGNLVGIIETHGFIGLSWLVIELALIDVLLGSVIFDEPVFLWLSAELGSPEGYIAVQSVYAIALIVSFFDKFRTECEQANDR